ncbi:hypothetical protein SmJEL517_g03579 [Synchytrium microbalum]|uniref:AAA+ ATPase domain-containing protein n=1 Tax=Synchytrium microbalum TaxID=1806994 RepID=A0A507BW88_9FUNG|nr:uncharacterized protein SmJEL517_g03579 [Synchytrium microbalum]TPX33630.1 hypothetical protein SmJEL517_g03579 [Synchytrium microbalum]
MGPKRRILYSSSDDDGDEQEETTHAPVPKAEREEIYSPPAKKRKSPLEVTDLDDRHQPTSSCPAQVTKRASKRPLTRAASTKSSTASDTTTSSTTSTRSKGSKASSTLVANKKRKPTSTKLKASTKQDDSDVEQIDSDIEDSPMPKRSGKGNDHHDDEDDFEPQVQTAVRAKQKTIKSPEQSSLKRWVVPGAAGPTYMDDSSSSSQVKKPISTELNELWIDKFHPVSEAELAVHSRKVSEVRGWLQAATSNRPSKRERILCLTGPSGAGKTAALRVLASEMRIEILEWLNPFNNNLFEGTEDGEYTHSYESITQRFTQFLERADKYPSLTFESSSQTSIPQQVTQSRKLILMEDLPNVSNDKTRAVVHSAVRAFANSRRSKFPLVFIVSEVACTGGDPGRFDEKSVTVKDVVPSDVSALGCVAEIRFNPIAPTLIKKCLARICEMVYRTASQKLHRPTSSDIEHISKTSNGDIRCAINGMQFMGLTRHETRVIGTSAGKSGKGKKKAESMDLQNPFTRDVSLLIFRVLGKILYNKREGDGRSHGIGDKRISKPPTVYQLYEPDVVMRPQGVGMTKLPSYMAHYERKPFAREPERIAEDGHMEADFLNAYLHQNYPPFYIDIEEIEVAADYLASADLLLAPKMFRNQLSTYATSLATRGLAFAHLTNLPESNPLFPDTRPRPPHVFRPFYRPQVFQVNSDIRTRDEYIRKSMWCLLNDSVNEQENEGVGNGTRVCSMTSFDVGRVDLIPYMAKILKPQKNVFGVVEQMLPPYLAPLVSELTQFPNTHPSQPQLRMNAGHHDSIDENDVVDKELPEDEDAGIPLSGRISNVNESEQALMSPTTPSVGRLVEIDDIEAFDDD